VQVLDVMVPGGECDIPVRVYQASADAPSQVLVYFHGGGFVMGSIKSHDAVCRRLAKYSQVLRGIHNNFGC
jgi:acetyl esterase